MGQVELTPKDVIEQTGIPRATVYRRLAKGETAADILASVKPPEAAPEAPEPDDTAEINQSAIEWAHSILWAAKHSGVAKMSRAKAGSQAKFAMWEFGRENTKELMVNLVPKAMMILDKNKKPEEQAELEAAERKSIGELEDLLAGAIKEAGVAA